MWSRFLTRPLKATSNRTRCVSLAGATPARYVEFLMGFLPVWTLLQTHMWRVFNIQREWRSKFFAAQGTQYKQSTVYFISPLHSKLFLHKSIADKRCKIREPPSSREKTYNARPMRAHKWWLPQLSPLDISHICLDSKKGQIFHPTNSSPANSAYLEKKLIVIPKPLWIDGM